VNSTDVKQAVRERVEAYDRCWVDGRPEDLRAFLHPSVLFTGPRFERLVEGIDACVRSYVTFLTQARVRGFNASDYAIDVAENTAVVTYRWTIDYEMNGKRSTETGQDLLVWVLTESSWLLAWRTQRSDQA
jgi:hypothetical protein